MSNVNNDLLDEGLQAVMGNERGQDVTAVVQRERAKASAQKQPDKNMAADASWVPVKERGSLDKIKECAKWALLFASISALLFYWQQAGLLASSAAVPSLILCALGAGLTVGYHAR